MALEFMKMCDICGDWFPYYAGHGVEIKKRGYCARYYCPRCIAKSIKESEEMQNEHNKSKENK